MIKMGGARSSEASRAENDETQTRAGVGEVISRQQNLTPERRRRERERGSDNKKRKGDGGRGRRSRAERRACEERTASDAARGASLSAKTKPEQE